MGREKWILVFLGGRAGGDGLSYLDPIRIMKGTFLICQELQWRKHAPYTFVPYRYGPFSVEVYRDLTLLQQEELVASRSVVGYTWKEYAATSKGRERGEEFAAGLPQDVREFIWSLRDWIARVSFETLLRAVYAKYPTFATESVLSHLAPTQ